jgi:hypothetical protein
MRLSIVIEWANTRLNGVPRAWTLLDVLAQQWQAIGAGTYPGTLPPVAGRFLDRLDHRAELLVVSGAVLNADLENEVRRRVPDCFDLGIHVAPGLEYYPLKNFGGRLANGDLLLFVDSDVLPEDGWLAYLLGSFGRPEVDVVCGQTYVAPTDLFSRAFATFWTYALRAESPKFFQPRKFYANTIAMRSAVFRPTGFPSIGRRTRGATSLLGKELGRRGISIWENQSAKVSHPPPASLRHMVIRAVAHGRDHYMKRSDERNLYGLAWSQAVAAGRLGSGLYRTLRDWRRVGLRPWEVPVALAICSAYYACFALGGVLTHLNPAAMGRRFRV